MAACAARQSLKDQRINENIIHRNGILFAIIMFPINVFSNKLNSYRRMDTLGVSVLTNQLETFPPLTSRLQTASSSRALAVSNQLAKQIELNCRHR
jgi:hypothetical protein